MRDRARKDKFDPSYALSRGPKHDVAARTRVRKTSRANLTNGAAAIERLLRYALAVFCYALAVFFLSKNCSSSVEWLNAVVEDWLPCTVVVTASK